MEPWDEVASEATNPPLLLRLVIGLGPVLMGATVLGALVGAVPTDGGRFLAPPLILAALGAGLVLAGALVWMPLEAPAIWRSTLASLAILLILIACNWSAFGPDVSYSSTTSVGPFAWWGEDQAGGRIVFGAVAVLFDLIVVAGTLSWLLARYKNRT